MTREHNIQTILRSEIIQWRTLTKDQLIENLVLSRHDVLDSLDTDFLDELVEEVDVAKVWGQAL